MGFWTFIEGVLLVVNAFAILNEDRFLTPKGLSFDATTGKGKSIKQQAVGLIYVAQYFRLPLILLNIVIIIFKLFSG